MAFHESTRRSVAKSATFRVLVMAADGFIILTLTGSLQVALVVIVVSNFSSSVIFYFHERGWNRLHWGKEKRKNHRNHKKKRNGKINRYYSSYKRRRR